MQGTLSRADTDTEAVDESTNDKHTNVLRGTNYDGANTPDDCANLNGPFSTKYIRQLDKVRWARNQ